MTFQVPFLRRLTIVVDNLVSQPLIIKYIKEKIPNYAEAVIVSPDAGGAKRFADT